MDPVGWTVQPRAKGCSHVPPLVRVRLGLVVRLRDREDKGEEWWEPVPGTASFTLYESGGVGVYRRL